MKIKQEGHHEKVEGDCDPSLARVNLLSLSLSVRPCSTFLSIAKKNKDCSFFLAYFVFLQSLPSFCFVPFLQLPLFFTSFLFYVLYLNVLFIQAQRHLFLPLSLFTFLLRSVNSKVRPSQDQTDELGWT